MKFQYEPNHRIGCHQRPKYWINWMNALRPLMCVVQDPGVLKDFTSLSIPFVSIHRTQSNHIDLLEPFFFRPRKAIELCGNRKNDNYMVRSGIASIAAHPTSKVETENNTNLIKLDQNLFRARWAISYTEMLLPCLHFQPKTRNLISKETKRERIDDDDMAKRAGATTEIGHIYRFCACCFLLRMKNRM